MHEAADEARRARRCAPVQAALQRRRDMQYCKDADAAARRIQAEWRARQMRLWCQRVDRSARRLQRWTRRRWLRHRLELVYSGIGSPLVTQSSTLRWNGKYNKNSKH